MKLSAKIANDLGINPKDVAKNSTIGRALRRRGVARSMDFRRIEDLPRREWNKDGIEQLAKDITAYLSIEGVQNPYTLWPIQAAALHDAHDIQGAFLPVPVGGGKALISLLAPSIIEAKRPLLLVPASLRDQTIKEVIPKFKPYFKLHRNLSIMSYAELSLEKNKDLLWKMQPDLIVMDECHRLKNSTAGRTRRIKRYLTDYPSTRIVAMSGTISNRSLRDYWHIILWTHKEELCPLPVTWRELQDWADALDEGLDPSQRVAPGALSRFCREGESPRQGYRRRLTETPGVVAAGETELGTSLQIHSIKPKQSREAIALQAQVRELWADPNGDPIMEAIALWRRLRELAMGFWYKWDPAPPEDWLEARKAWHTFVRDRLRYNRKGLDTPLQVWNEAKNKVSPPYQWMDWAEIKDTFEINTVPVWVDNSIIDAAGDWLVEHEGICWVEHAALGKAIEKTTGFPFFGAGANVQISRASGPIVASISAHGEGKNLQRYSKNLITCPPSSGKVWEQLLGRTHRAGQEADQVDVWVMQHTLELADAVRKACGDARYLEDTLGSKQKLNYADITFSVGE